MPTLNAGPRGGPGRVVWSSATTATSGELVSFGAAMVKPSRASSAETALAVVEKARPPASLGLRGVITTQQGRSAGRG